MFTFRPGEVCANRFDVDSIAGAGGMGTVYRARDQLSGDWVALKILHAVAANPQGGSRFAREAQLLTELRHPGIVRHVAHGVAASGDAYLAMEWLDGEDLRHRLQRGGLSLSESLSLMRQVTTALASVHSRGVIHRDLKPSNVFLRNSDVGRATLIDFGIARRGARSQAITGTGRVIGTPEYMAPEQARGEQTLTPAADIFSLGCIFFECLTGAPPFVGEHFAAVLAKILFDQPGRLLELRPDLPESVARLVHRMLAKEARGRPADAAGLLVELDALAGLDAPAPLLSPGRESLAALTDSDQGLVCVLVAMPRRSPGEVRDETLESLEMEAKHSLRLQIRRAVERSGARVELMIDGSLVTTFTAVRGTATDLVTDTVRTALLIRDIWPEACLALATGRGVLGGAIPSGEALDRAAQMLRSGAEMPAPEKVLLDEISAGLLDARFRTRRTPSGTFELSSVELSADESRLLLGKPTPCVGREAELATLDGSLTTCIQDSHPRVVLVTAPPGIGKSRLRHEFLQRVAARGERVAVLVARGDPLTTHSAYGLFGQAVRRLCKVQDGEPLEIRRQKLLQRAAARVGAGEAASVAEFLGEICGIPFPAEESARLRAARQDPQIMSERVQEAALAFLRAECAAQPVILVLEDLHWGDVPTVRLIELALTELGDLSLLVLALARPEFSDQFPNVWAEHVQPLPLRPLSKRASERLAAQTLGAAATPSVLARIVEQAGGNALYLEELIRAVAEGKGDELPGTVLAMLQARIGRLDPGARRVLRAASAFGETFWLGGVCALLGVDERRDEIALHIETLTTAEIIEPRRSSRFAGERELHFRHAVMRDAAYALLSEEERRACHRLCLSYLEQVGEVDPAVLSEHALRAGDSERTLRYVIQATQRAFDRCDIDAAERFAEIGLRSGAYEEARGALLATLMWVHSTRQRYAELFEIEAEALSLLPQDSARWLFVISQTLVASLVTGRQDILLDMIRLRATARPAPDTTILYATTACVITAVYLAQGQRALIQEVLRDCERAVDTASPGQTAPRGFLMLSRSYLEFRMEPKPFAALASAQAAAAVFEEYGHRHYRLISGNQLALTMMHVGRYDEGADLLHEMISDAQRSRDPFYATMATLNLVSGLSAVGSREAAAQAVSLGRPIMAAAGAPSALLHAAMPHLAEALLQVGEHEEAERVAREAQVVLKTTPLHRVIGCTALARILLQRGQAAAARASAEEGLLLVQSLGGCGHTEVPLRVVLAEARHADGDADAARQALREAMAQLLLRADDAPDAESRARYLFALLAHARLCALSEPWLGERVT